ncbi:tannase/feruloyl esterase family alpha/beta hydrolase [Blastococcus sp. TF02A_35]|uniref:tannase/feruloyl esterase family alpha/beta hydrolase n=1 Tax=Blastococcus sp. TF02A-35 TaxID=2559612 RepID=UPI001073558F|nr:tannase/feruloyl esterase family alpha/beta hydrolase [Blastococcus sp. TF02A_35]TFV51730.1 tannase/feruloyl esterase family alpha/beta hydrolase [Blastococcus sp. TF02A_35]
MTRRFHRVLAVTAATLITATGVTAAATSAAAAPPSHSSAAGKGHLAPARPGTLLECASLVGFSYARTTITSAALVPAGTVTNAGAPVGEHCQVRGEMNRRVSPVDGKSYAIGFEMRLPRDWAGRYLYQANGGVDGTVVPAYGNVTGGQLRSGLQMGFAVLSSDAGHGTPTPDFGRDPQARLDYGYQAVGTLTPMAKKLIAAAYGRGPDRSYFAGGSNGGRHTMVAAARYADQYDGFLAVAPGFNLPKAAVAQMWGAQQWATVATGPNLETAFPKEQRQLVADAILRSCDGLDRLADGMVQDAEGCARAFDLDEAVPTCAAGPEATCLTAAQKEVVERVFAGARNSAGAELYSPFYFDPGLTSPGWATWKFQLSVLLDPGAVGLIFSTPPTDPATVGGPRNYALSYDVDTQYGKLFATDGTYRESGMSFMTPPNPTNLDTLRTRGAKMVVAHGVSDAVFSAKDTARWYEELDRAYRGKAGDFVRYFEVPGMGHVSGGPATDQFDGLGAVVDWVERGKAPDRIVATARGAGNPGGANPEVPATWAADRSRPLCPFPLVATYKRGDVEDAASFDCKKSSGKVASVPGAGHGGGRG